MLASPEASLFFDFWKAMPRAARVVPQDQALLKTWPNQAFPFRQDCLPAAFDGPLRSARVVLLFLNPGYSEQDSRDAETDEGIDRHHSRWTGERHLSTLDEHAEAHKWWSARLRQFGDVSRLAPHTAVLNICCYHSPDFECWPMLAALPSSRASIAYAQGVLFPEAMRGERVVVSLRSQKYWGLASEGRFGESLFVPRVQRGGFLVGDQTSSDTTRETIATAINRIVD